MKPFNNCLLCDKFQRISDKNSAGNTNILTISAQHGLINQFEYYNHQYASENTSGYTLLKKGDFAYNKSYSDGYPWGATKRLERYDSGVVSPLYICFAAKEGVCADFYSYYFESEPFFREIYKIAQEGARNHGLLNVSTEDFFKMQIANPPLEEQQRIAEFLGCCDRVIALKKELIAEKKKQKKALMQKLLNPDGGFRLPGFSGEWKKDVLGCFIDLISGVDFSTEDLLSDNSFTPYLTGASNIDNNTLILNRWVVDPKNIALKNDILVVCKGSGVGAMIIMPIQKAHIARQFMAIRVHPTSSNKYIYYILQNSLERIRNEAQGLIVGIDRGTILKLNVAMPDKEEQQAIADILSAADKEIDLLEQELVQQEQKKKSLMQLLLTGIVRV